MGECNVAIIRKQEDIKRAKEELATITLPKEGQLSMLLGLQNAKKVQSMSIERLKSELNALYELSLKLKEEYKKMSIEYEKAKHLKELEIKKMVKELKLKETKELDEVAAMLFNNKRSGR